MFSVISSHPLARYIAIDVFLGFFCVIGVTNVDYPYFAILSLSHVPEMYVLLTSF